jgi:GNAT superfamily N-acetyltransferase
MERLTDDVRTLASVVRTQGSNMEGEIQKLVVAVTQASGPRKTDWSTIIAAVMLIMAIGSAVFWPLNQSTQENKERIEAYHQDFQEHKSQDSQGITAALIQRLEEHARVQDSADRQELLMWRHRAMGLADSNDEAPSPKPAKPVSKLRK